MPRYRRLHAPGSVQHVICRFVNGRFLLDEPEAREEYLDRAGRALRGTDWTALAYALMSSHVHWVMVAGTTPSAAFIRALNSGFAGWLNRRTGGLGPVFADRHRTIVCGGDSALALISYVHNNPVRAGLVQSAEQSDWTSHRAYVGLAPAAAWLDRALGLSLSGIDDTAEGRARFSSVVRERGGWGRSIELSAIDLVHRRAAARASVRAPVEITVPRIERSESHALEARTGVVWGPDAVIRPEFRGRPTMAILVVARASGVPEELMRSRSRHRAVTSARRLALLLWCEGLARPAVQMSQALGIGASAACGLMARAQPHERARARELAAQLLA